jgi:outer membrane protein TolC
MSRRALIRRTYLVVLAALSAAAPIYAAQDAPAAGAPLTLATAVAEALRHSPALRATRDGLAVAEIHEEVVRAGFGLKVTPSLTTGAGTLAGGSSSLAGVTVSKRLRTGTELAVRGDWQRYRNTISGDAADAGYAIAIAQPLLRGAGPAATADLRLAERGRLSSRRGWEQARQQVVLDVAAS